MKHWILWWNPVFEANYQTTVWLEASLKTSFHPSLFWKEFGIPKPPFPKPQTWNTPPFQQLKVFETRELKLTSWTSNWLKFEIWTKKTWKSSYTKTDSSNKSCTSWLGDLSHFSNIFQPSWHKWCSHLKSPMVFRRSQITMVRRPTLSGNMPFLWAISCSIQASYVADLVKWSFHDNSQTTGN